MMDDSILKGLRGGNFVLIHDSKRRENETDLVMAAESVTAEDIVRMRVDGGGLICVAVGREISMKLGLPFMSDLIDSGSTSPVTEYLKADDIPYDEKSSFSVSINHRNTFTGITDLDRALTIREFAVFSRDLDNYDEGGLQKEFGSRFRSPGHVHLLISSGLENREGHTELSTALLRIAGLTPVAVICEMLDGRTHKALSREDAASYAKRNNLGFLEVDEVKEAYKRWLG